MYSRRISGPTSVSNESSFAMPMMKAVESSSFCSPNLASCEMTNSSNASAIEREETLDVVEAETARELGALVSSCDLAAAR